MSFITCTGEQEWIEPVDKPCFSVSPAANIPDPVGEHGMCTPCDFPVMYKWQAKSIGGGHERQGYPSPDSSSPKLFLSRNTSVSLQKKRKPGTGYPGYTQTMTVTENVDAEMDELGNETISGSGSETARSEGRLISSPYTLCSYFDQEGSISIDEDGCVSGSWEVTGKRSTGSTCEPVLDDNSDGTYSGQRKQARTCPGVAGMSSHGDFSGCTLGPSDTTITEDSKTVEHDKTSNDGNVEETYTWQATYFSENTDEMLGAFLDGQVSDVLPALSEVPFGASYSIFRGARTTGSACGVGYKPTSHTFTDEDMEAAIEAAEAEVSLRQDQLTEAQGAESEAQTALETWPTEWEGIHAAYKAYRAAVCNGEAAEPPEEDVFSRWGKQATLEADLAAAIHNRLDADLRLAAAQARLDAANEAADLLQSGQYCFMPSASHNAGSVYRQNTVVILDSVQKREARVRLRIDIPRIAKEDEKYNVTIDAASQTFMVTIEEGNCYAYTPEFEPPEEVDLYYEEVEITKIDT